jgi:F-type H+-transporting ATPase subunit a
MFPLNVVSEFVPILSMALRLFGNIAGGALILTLVYGAGWASVLVTPALHVVFRYWVWIDSNTCYCLIDRHISLQ